MKTYTAGIIGFGFIGKVHAYAHANLPFFFRDLPFQTRITHVCSGHEETAEAGCRLVGADVATTDYRCVTEDPAVDIVHICTPNHLHREALLSAMAHGKHIYCDKPLTATADEADAIEAAMETYGGTAQMTFQNRFFPSSIRARQLVAEGVLGDVLQVRAAFLHGGSADPEAPLKWKLSRGSGGGVIADLGSHMLDFLSMLLGDYERLTALSHIAYPDRPSVDVPGKRVPVDAEDCMMVLARMRSGAVGTIESTKLASGTEDELRLEIHGSAGALRFNSMDPHHVGLYRLESPDQPVGGTRGWTQIDTGQRYPDPGGFPGAKLSIGWLRSHVQCLYEFLADLHAGRPGEPGIDQGIYIQRLMGAIRESAREQAWVEAPHRVERVL